MRDYPVVSADGHLADNSIWDVPKDTNEVRGNLKSMGMWSIPVSYRALAMDMHGRIFGLRTLSKPRESGYELEGRVSIEGKSYRAFTSSKLFKRADRSLCDVAIVYVCGTPNKQWPDPLTIHPRLYQSYIKGLVSRYFYQTSGIYFKLKEYARCLELIADGTDELYPWVGYKGTADSLRVELAGPMGWDLTNK